MALNARLRELFGDDPQTLAEIERDFEATVRDAEREIAGTDDCAIIARAAHRLKGAAGVVGATALHEVAASIEKAALAQDVAAVRLWERGPLARLMIMSGAGGPRSH